MKASWLSIDSCTERHFCDSGFRKRFLLNPCIRLRNADPDPATVKISAEKVGICNKRRSFQRKRKVSPEISQLLAAIPSFSFSRNICCTLRISLKNKNTKFTVNGDVQRNINFYVKFRHFLFEKYLLLLQIYGI